jgi:hypothetical protein
MPRMAKTRRAMDSELLMRRPPAQSINIEKSAWGS